MEARRARRPTVRGLASRLKSADSVDLCKASALSPEKCGRGGTEAHRDHRPTVRGLASRMKSADSIDRDAASTGSTDNEECHVYSNRVDEVFKSLPHMLFASPTATTSSPDAKKQKVIDAKSPLNPGSHESSTTPVKSMLASGSDESSQEVLKDPTPPPTPKSNAKKPRRGMKRAVRKAVTRLEKVQKFLDRNSDDVIVVGEDLSSSQSPSKDRTTEIKFRTRTGIIRYKMNPTDRFANIMSSVADREGVSESDIIMFINDRTVQPYDSPRSLGITVADIVECHVRGMDALTVASRSDDDNDDPSQIRLILQTKDAKAKKCSLVIGKDEPMEKLMRQYCSQMHVKYGSIRFQFDGERVDPSATPQSLELESDFCIDVLPC